MNDSFDWNALDRYFSGACSRAEAEAVARRAARDPKLARELAELERIWASGAGTRSVDVHAAWQAMHDRMTAAQRAATALRIEPFDDAADRAARRKHRRHGRGGRAHDIGAAHQLWRRRNYRLSRLG